MNESQTVSGMVSGLFDESEKPRSEVGVTGFEPATSWSRTNNRPIQKHRPDGDLFAQVDLAQKAKSHSADTQNTDIHQTADTNEKRIGIRGYHGPDLLAGGGHKTLLTCTVCGKAFFRARVRDDRTHRHCCSPACASVLAVAASHANYKTPESTKADRVRAQGLVNKRINLGWFKKPDRCCLCGEHHRRISAHHADYSKPDQVHWICPGCHLSVHHFPEKLASIPPFVCDRQTPPPPRHSKGGRRLPPELRKQRAPQIGIRRVEFANGQVIEHLACGHTYPRPEDGKRHKQRRCLACRDNARKGVVA